jgi:glycosyltransferase involved in cell wall biosynthesis
LIIIDDGSTDSTFETALGLAKNYPHHLIVKKNPYNLGKGRALKKSLHYATGEYVVFLDADLDLHPLQVQTLFDIMPFPKEMFRLTSSFLRSLNFLTHSGISRNPAFFATMVVLDTGHLQKRSSAESFFHGLSIAGYRVLSRYKFLLT